MLSIHRVVGAAVIALAVVGCERSERSERSERERAGAMVDRNDTLFVLPPPLPNTEPQVNAPAAPAAGESAMQQAETSEPASSAGDSKKSAQQQRSAMKETPQKATPKKATPPAQAERASEPSEETTARTTTDEAASDEPVGTATITSGVLIVPFGDTTEKPSGAESTQAPPAAGTSPGGSTNQSTTLGNGQSGMYTGGEGTYGGRATWGTGAGAR